MRPVISIIRDTKLCTAAAVRAFVRAQQVQIDRDFSPDYGRSAKVVYGPAKGAWPVYLRDTSDVPGAIGYHEMFNHPYDHTGTIAAPLTMAAGGYLAIEQNGQWTQVFADAAPGVRSRRRSAARVTHRVGFS